MRVRRWDCPKIDRLFSEEEAGLIKSIPLSSRRVADRLCWSLEKNGCFTMKSSYRYAFVHSTSYSPLLHVVGIDFWKKLWKTCIPNKAKVHAWRVCIDILPSRGALHAKRVELESTVCVLCESSGESTLHLCRDCPYTKQVIQMNPILKDICYRWGNMHVSAIDWLVQCAKISLLVILVICSLFFGVCGKRGMIECGIRKPELPWM